MNHVVLEVQSKPGPCIASAAQYSICVCRQSFLPGLSLVHHCVLVVLFVCLQLSQADPLRYAVLSNDLVRWGPPLFLPIPLPGEATPPPTCVYVARTGHASTESSTSTF